MRRRNKGEGMQDGILTPSSELLQEFQEIGRDLFVSSLISSHGGNMSVRRGNSIIITRHGSMLGRLKDGTLIETKIDAPLHPLASTELIVHKTIYRRTPALAVVHAHPISAVALSVSVAPKEIVPLDLESEVLVGNVPVLEVEIASGSQELADAVSEALREHRIVVVRGHGSFAIGQTLEEAFEWTSCLEQASRVILSSTLAELASRAAQK